MAEGMQQRSGNHQLQTCPTKQGPQCLKHNTSLNFRILHNVQIVQQAEDPKAPFLRVQGQAPSPWLPQERMQAWGMEAAWAQGTKVLAEAARSASG